MAEPPYGHEPSGIAVRRVLQIGAILAVIVIVLVTVIRFVVGEWVVPQHAQVAARPGTIPPTPRLQAYPGKDAAALHRRKQALLSSWEWTDPRHQFAHIPVERAMALYARQHAADEANAVTTPRPEESAR